MRKFIIISAFIFCACKPIVVVVECNHQEIDWNSLDKMQVPVNIDTDLLKGGGVDDFYDDSLFVVPWVRSYIIIEN